MAVITIQFEGLCCHIEPPAAPIAAGRRTILPDATAHSHISYIEVYPADVDPAANPQFAFISYTRDNISYRRVNVSDVKIELLNITSTSFTVLPSFTERIPKLQSVEPSFLAIKPSLLAPTIGSGQVAAYFDITAGVLSSGPSESFRTEFVPTNLWPSKHLGQWAELEVEISGTATLRVTDLATGTFRDLVLKNGADLITIGNQVAADILGIPPGTGGRPGHFDIYYDMATGVTGRPQPKLGMGLGTGCSDSNWP